MDEHAQSSDEQLAEATRAGDIEAYAELWQRHSNAGYAAARSFRNIADADDILSEAYLQILRALQRGGGPHEAFRPYLYRTVRNVALTWGRKRTPDFVELSDTLESSAPSTEDTVLEKTITVRAFRTLPERWQTVLWYTEVEGMEPMEASTYLGLSAGATAALAHRAREGLKKAWLQSHVSDVRVPLECRWTTERMGDYVQGTLTSRARQRFDEHLKTCSRCSILLEEIDGIGSKLAVILLPLMLGGGAGAAMIAGRRGSTRDAASASASASRSAPQRVAITAVAIAAIVVAIAVAAPALLEPSVPQSVPTPEAASPSTPPPMLETEATDAEPDSPQVPPPPPVSPPTVGLDVSAPSAPVLLSPADATLTNLARPLFTGSGEAGARVEGDSAGTLFSAVVDANGSWQLQAPSGLADGQHTFRFSLVDAAGNRSSFSDVTLILDTVALAPVAQTLSSPLLYLPVLTGTGEAGATVRLMVDGAPAGGAAVDSTGQWSLPLPDPGADGATISFTQTDLAGNISPASAPSDPLLFTRPDILLPAEGELIPSNAGATVVTLTLDGIEGMQIEVLVDGVSTGNLHTLEQDPIVRVTVPLSDGPHVIAVRYRGAGNAEIGSLATRNVIIQP